MWPDYQKLTSIMTALSKSTINIYCIVSFMNLLIKYSPRNVSTENCPPHQIDHYNNINKASFHIKIYVFTLLGQWSIHQLTVRLVYFDLSFDILWNFSKRYQSPTSYFELLLKILLLESPCKWGRINSNGIVMPPRNDFSNSRSQLHTAISRVLS